MGLSLETEMLNSDNTQTVEEEFEEVFLQNFPSREEDDQDQSTKETLEEVFQQNSPLNLKEDLSVVFENIEKSEYQFN